MSQPKRRLKLLNRTLSTPTTAPAVIGTLKLGSISYQVPESSDSSRLPHIVQLLDINDAINQDNLHFMLQKYLLGQDIFLLSQPGPYARRLAMTFCSLINSEYEYVAIHRDVGETELKQGREIRENGTLVYVDSAAVKAVKLGRVLILEGIEKAERGIMPVLNNLLENREMNLEDGTHIVHPARFDLLDSSSLSDDLTIIPAHRNFRVIAIAAPVPPYQGYPLDPPFRSRFQARFIDSLGASLSSTNNLPNNPRNKLAEKLTNIIVTSEYANDIQQPLSSILRKSIPEFPQTSLSRLRDLTERFPSSSNDDDYGLSPEQLARLLVSLHPGLLHAPFSGWATISRQCEEAGLSALGNPAESSIDDDTGFLRYRLRNIERIDEQLAHLVFEYVSLSGGVTKVSLPSPAGPRPLLTFSYLLKPLFVLQNGTTVRSSPRLLSTLTSLLQAHALGWDISLLPPVQPITASCSTSILVQLFGELLGYEADNLHLYKEIGGRELLMRRQINDGGCTSWQPSPLIQGAWTGKLVHLSGIDTISSTAGSLSRLVQDRESELWEGKRLVQNASEEEVKTKGLTTPNPSFRIITTASKSIPLRDWLSTEHANMFLPILTRPMDASEESSILASTGCPLHIVSTLIQFATKYRDSISLAESNARSPNSGGGGNSVIKNRRLGTRALVRIAKRVAALPWDDDLHMTIRRALLADFLPPVERMALDNIFLEADIRPRAPAYNAAPRLENDELIFEANYNNNEVDSYIVSIWQFDASKDMEGVATHVPHMEHFFDNSLQSGLMRDMAVDLEMLGEYLVLLGNQGVGKNKIIDRLCQLLRRPREYVQLHRDTTVPQLLFTTTLSNGTLTHSDSPLLRAIRLGRICIVDEADKAPAHVVAVFRSLGSHGEMSLPDGRKVVRGTMRGREREDDIVVHPDFRLVLLANRPGYPFLGNHFLQVLGDNFSCHSVPNPDMLSERLLLKQLAPEIEEDTIRRLVAAFQDLRDATLTGKLSYPYSLRELINVVRHMRAYPDDPLEDILRNVFDFDVYKPEAMEFLLDVLNHHGLKINHLGLQAIRHSESSKKQIKEIKFDPKSSSDVSKPKFGKEDPDNEEHFGGNTWAGGTGGRDTAGLGGKGGYMRLFKGHNIKQISDKDKNLVPDHIKDQARQMAREELKRRLEELDMSAGEAKEYGGLLAEVEAHVNVLFELLENLNAREEERVWVKRQTDGELDDSRLMEGLTGETTVYKRRGMDRPELGKPQIKPKRIRFVFDVSGSMYRFQYDGRLQRSLETAVMLMEAFNRLSRQDKYVWDMYGHSGDSPEIPLVESDGQPTEVRDRWKVIEKMSMITQYAFAGDYTVEAIEKAVDEVAKFDADDWFVIAISDANFGRYEITLEELRRAMDRHPKVRTALICIGEGAEASWIPKNFVGRGFRVSDTHDIPKVLRSILSSMIDG